MSLISFFIFFISFTIFGGIMLHDPRTLWSGVTFFWMMACLALFAFFTLSQYSQWLMSHNVVIGILVFLVVLAMGCVVAFPAVLVLIFFVEGIRVIRHEGMKPANLLSLLFSVLLSIYLVLWPRIGNLQRDTLSRRVYGIISFSAVYFLSLDRKSVV